MSRIPGVARLLVPALVVAAALTGCGGGEPTRTASTTGTGRLTEGLPAAAPAAATPAADVAEQPDGPDGPGAEDTPDPALSGQPVPTLPPGDPGSDGAGSGDHAGDRGHEAVTEVPVGALLDAETVGAVAGGRWAAGDVPAEGCAAPRAPGSRVTRAGALTSDGGALVQTVTAHETPRAAVRAVGRAVLRLEACGWAAGHDPRLGEASRQLTRTTPDGTEQVALVLAAEGVGVALVGSGSAAEQGTWESLADLALGSSCLAASDGCH
jgi:hypothetical protein